MDEDKAAVEGDGGENQPRLNVLVKHFHQIFLTLKDSEDSRSLLGLSDSI